MSGRGGKVPSPVEPRSRRVPAVVGRGGSKCPCTFFEGWGRLAPTDVGKDGGGRKGDGTRGRGPRGISRSRQGSLRRTDTPGSPTLHDRPTRKPTSLTHPSSSFLSLGRTWVKRDHPRCPVVTLPGSSPHTRPPTRTSRAPRRTSSRRATRVRHPQRPHPRPEVRSQDVFILAFRTLVRVDGGSPLTRLGGHGSRDYDSGTPTCTPLPCRRVPSHTEPELEWPLRSGQEAPRCGRDGGLGPRCDRERHGPIQTLSFKGRTPVGGLQGGPCPRKGLGPPDILNFKESYRVVACHCDPRSSPSENH